MGLCRGTPGGEVPWTFAQGFDLDDWPLFIRLPHFVEADSGGETWLPARVRPPRSASHPTRHHSVDVRTSSTRCGATSSMKCTRFSLAAPASSWTSCPSSAGAAGAVLPLRYCYRNCPILLTAVRKSHIRRGIPQVGRVPVRVSLTKEDAQPRLSKSRNLSARVEVALLHERCALVLSASRSSHVLLSTAGLACGRAC